MANSGDNWVGDDGCSGHSLAQHLAAFDALPAILRIALNYGWEDWCAIAVADMVDAARARGLASKAALASVLEDLAQMEEEDAAERDRAATARLQAAIAKAEQDRERRSRQAHMHALHRRRRAA